MIEVITTKKQWDLVIEEVDSYDFYSTYDYHELSINSDEKPILIKYTHDDIIVGLPLILRKIPNTSYFDATSVYGYAGPISKNMCKDFDNQLFKNELNDFFINNRIVSVFSRLNPYLEFQNTILNGIGEIKIKGEIVMIDLNLGLEEQRQQYQKRIKSHINKARNLCTIKKAESKEDIAAFIDLYYENMKRVDAKKSYFFSNDYFYKFTHNDHCENEILLASLRDTNEIISGAMFIKSKDIIQYHLSGTKTEFIDIGAIKMLIDEMRIEGTNENFKYLNLGGGLHSKDDSLLRFKKSFSKSLKHFSVWEYVVDNKTYNELTNTNNAINLDFFPNYRSHE